MAAPEAPKEGLSMPAFAFHSDSRQMISLLGTLIQNTEVLEKILGTVATAIQSGACKDILSAEDIRHATEYTKGKLGGPTADFMRCLPYQLELLFCRSIDNFLTYVSDLLAHIFTLRPEMLTSEKIDLRMVLQYEDRSELLAAITERNVIGLSHKGMKELNEELTKTFDFPLFEGEALNMAIILIEQRNLLTHNRGVVNRHFLNRAPAMGKKLGDKLVFDAGQLKHTLDFLDEAVARIDMRAADKFGITIHDKMTIAVHPGV